MSHQPLAKQHTNPTRAIAEFCLWCVGGNVNDRRECQSRTTCPLWHFRLGKSPYRPKRTKTQIESAKQNLAKISRRAGGRKPVNG